MKPTEKATRLLTAGVLYYSSDEKIFFIGGHVGMGEFDLREVQQDVGNVLSKLLVANKIKLSDRQYTNACVGALGVRDDDFKPYWVTIRKVTVDCV